MSENSETWDGALTVSAGGDGTDSYDFGSRAAAVTSLKSGLRLPEMTPLPSPWTLEIEPTLLCNARCHFYSYEDLIRDFRERQFFGTAGMRSAVAVIPAARPPAAGGDGRSG
jgi:hypothetical protein